MCFRGLFVVQRRLTDVVRIMDVAPDEGISHAVFVAKESQRPSFGLACVKTCTFLASGVTEKFVKGRTGQPSK